MNRTPLIHIIILISFVLSTIGPWPGRAYGEDLVTLKMPLPGVRISVSPPLDPPVLKGMTVDPKNPFHFDFILDKGETFGQNDPERPKGVEGLQLKHEAEKLIKYFLASITTPEKDLWVNLSPYEKNRIIPKSFGQTDMGRDLLAQDYLLKQITSSLIYPEEEFGKKFWKRVYAESAKRYGKTDIPVNTFNKVWIVPEHAKVYEHGNTAYVVKARLKVMLEEDYLSMEKHDVGAGRWPALNLDKGQPNGLPLQGQVRNSLTDLPSANQSVGASQVVREIVLPQLEKEVNEGQNFAPLRQVYYSLILAVWFKKRMKDSILGQKYMDQNKVMGIHYDPLVSLRNQASSNHVSLRGTNEVRDEAILTRTSNPKKIASPSARNDTDDIESIYQRYLKAFKKGVYNYIKEEPDPTTGEMIPRKYFSGGAQMNEAMTTTQIVSSVDRAEIATDIFRAEADKDFASVAVDLRRNNPAMNSSINQGMDLDIQEFYSAKRNIYVLGLIHMHPYESSSFEAVIYDEKPHNNNQQFETNRQYCTNIDELLVKYQSLRDIQLKAFRRIREILQKNRSIRTIGVETTPLDLEQEIRNASVNYATLKSLFETRGYKNPDIADDLFMMLYGVPLYLYVQRNKLGFGSLQLIGLENEKEYKESFASTAAYSKAHSQLIDKRKEYGLVGAFATFKKWDDFNEKMLNENEIPDETKIEEVLAGFENSEARRVAEEGVQANIAFLRLSSQRDKTASQRAEDNMIIYYGTAHAKGIFSNIETEIDRNMDVQANQDKTSQDQFTPSRMLAGSLWSVRARLALMASFRIYKIYSTKLKGLITSNYWGPLKETEVDYNIGHGPYYDKQHFEEMPKLDKSSIRVVYLTGGRSERQFQDLIHRGLFMKQSYEFLQTTIPWRDVDMDIAYKRKKGFVVIFDLPKWMLEEANRYKVIMNPHRAFTELICWYPDKNQRQWRAIHPKYITAIYDQVTGRRLYSAKGSKIASSNPAMPSQVQSAPSRAMNAQASQAMNGNVQAPGGIDLTPKRMNLEVEKDKAMVTRGNVETQSFVSLQNIDIDGLYIKDIEIKPLTNLSEDLGIS